MRLFKVTLNARLFLGDSPIESTVEAFELAQSYVVAARRAEGATADYGNVSIASISEDAEALLTREGESLPTCEDCLLDEPPSLQIPKS